MGQPLHNSRLAHSGLANKTGIVLGAPAENLNESLDLIIASDNRVQLPFTGRLGQIYANLVQSRGPRGVTDASMSLRHTLVEEAYRLSTYLVQADAQAFQHTSGHPLLLAQ